MRRNDRLMRIVAGCFARIGLKKTSFFKTKRFDLFIQVIFSCTQEYNIVSKIKYR